MGIWPIWVYERYVEKHTTGFERQRLLNPRGEFVGEDFLNIRIAYDPMPVWMELAAPMTLFAAMGFPDYVTLHHHDLSFRHLVFAYDTKAKRYRDDVISQLKEIKRWRTGNALLNEFEGKLNFVTIVPYHGRSGLQNADVVTPGLGAEIRATAKGRPVKYGNPSDTRRGTGIGASATVEYTPDMWPVVAGPVDPGGAADEALYHELVHASRIVRGLADRMPVNKKYGDEEEYLAVLLANIYLSEKGQWVFRANHDNGILLGPPAIGFLNNPQHVDMPPRRLIEDFHYSQPHFYDTLAHLPPDRPKYNWVRQYHQEYIPSRQASRQITLPKLSH